MAPINGEALRYEMSVRGLTHKDLAALAHLTRVTVTCAANGHPVRPSTLRALAAALTLSPVLPGADKLVAA